VITFDKRLERRGGKSDFASNCERSEICRAPKPSGLNVSASLAERLEKAAPEVNERVENELLAKWMNQRGIDPKTLHQLP
jgi:hypothetical protein